MTDPRPHLSVDDKISGAPDARELARVWVANGNLAVVFDETLWDDPAAWGIFLADFMRHIRDAYVERHDSPPDEVMKRIGEGMRAELAAPDA
ncbi:MAG: DUF5076 domain-containing protein [Pseudomonadota bacterium]